MAKIALFRSHVLDAAGQQVVKAIVIGDDMSTESYDAIEEFLSSTEDHLMVLNEGTQIGWLG